jgi:hypothetical protein
MQMVFDQHSSALGQSACAVRLKVGAELGAEFVGTLPCAEPFAHAIRRGSSGLRVRSVVTDRIHQTIEILVGH